MKPRLHWLDAVEIRSSSPGCGSPCWLWTGAVNRPTGRGNTRQGPAHRMVYLEVRKTLPPGALYAECGVALCVNPDHQTTQPPPRRGHAPRPQPSRRATTPTRLLRLLPPGARYRPRSVLGELSIQSGSRTYYVYPRTPTRKQTATWIDTSTGTEGVIRFT